MKPVTTVFHNVGKSLSLRWKMILAFVLITLFPVVLIGSYASIVANDLIDAAARKDLEKVSRQTALEINSFLSSQLDGIRTEAQQPFLSDYLSLSASQRAGSQQEISARQILVIFSRKDPLFINSYALLDSSGLNLLDTEKGQIGSLEGDTDYFQSAFLSGLPYISTILFEPDETVFYISAPVRGDNGEFIGVLRAEYDAAVIQSMFMSIMPETGDFISLIDRNTYVRLADTGDTNLLNKSIKPISADQLADLQAQFLLPSGPLQERVMPSGDLVNGIDHLPDQPFFEAYSDSLGDDALITGAYLSTVPWVVLGGRSQTALSEPIIEQIRFTLLIAFATLAIAAILAVFVSGAISRPLTQLTSMAEKIAGGDFHTSAPVHSNDEVGTLALTFNFMTAKLRETLNGLEKELHDRKQAEDALRQSEERYRSFVEDMQDGAYRSTPDGKFVDVNQTMIKMFGYGDREEMLQVNITKDLYFSEENRIDLLHDSDQDKVSIFRMRRKDGSELWVEDHGHFVYDEYGNVIYHDGLLRDITERVKVEQALKESELQFRTIFNSSPVAICITAADDGTMLDANYAYWSITGYDPSTSIGRNSDELKLWDEPEERSEFIAKLKIKKSFYNPDDYFYHTDGSLKQVISFYELIHIGGRDCVLSMFHDMSEQKQTLQALQQSELRMRALLEAIPDMILEITLDGMISNMIPSKELDVSWSSENLTGRHVYEVLSQTAASQTLFAVERALASRQIHIFEFEQLLQADTRTFEARVVASLSDTALIMIRDVTQRKWIEAERELLINELEVQNRESETLRESLAASVTTFEVKELMERILDQIRRVIPYDSATVWRVDGDWQVMVTSRDLPPEIPVETLKFKIDAQNSSRPILMGDSSYVLSNNVQEELPDFKEPHSYINSWLAVPLKTRGKIIGVIALDGKQKDQFSEHQAKLAVAFADQLAIALDNISLFNELQMELEERQKLISELEIKNIESETLRESAAIVAATLERNEAVDRILEQLERVIHFDSASVQLLAGDQLKIVSTRGQNFLENEADSIFKADENDPAYPLLYGNLPYVLHDDVQVNFASFRVYPHNRIHAWMAVPLKVKGRILGIIAMDGYEIGRFTERHVSLAVTYANQVAIALENSRLFSDLQVELSTRQMLISELEAKNAELERFTYTVSHDLKSPLFTIRGFLGYLEQDALAGNHERMRSDIQRISDATSKMHQLLNDLLELSRIGRLMNDPVRISFDELAHEAVELVQGRILARGVTVHIDADLPDVYGDRPRLLEVLQNLVDNAAKFMGDQAEPRIAIGLSGMENDKYIFHVRDNGVGILPEHHERIFGLFNKLDLKADGTGIGLSLVKRILEVHGGRIWVQSEPSLNGEAGKGTTFFFTIPAVPVTES